MATQAQAQKQIAQRLKRVDELIKECERLATDNGVDFYFMSPCGSSEHFDAGETSDYSENGQPTGWDHSQC